MRWCPLTAGERGRARVRNAVPVPARDVGPARDAIAPCCWWRSCRCARLARSFARPPLGRSYTRSSGPLALLRHAALSLLPLIFQSTMTASLLRFGGCCSKPAKVQPACRDALNGTRRDVPVARRRHRCRHERHVAQGGATRCWSCRCSRTGGAKRTSRGGIGRARHNYHGSPTTVFSSRTRRDFVAFDVQHWRSIQEPRRRSGKKQGRR